MPSLSSVTSVKISPAGRAPTVARGLPVTLDVPGSWEDLTVGAVKAALADKFPKFYPTRQKLSLVGDRKPLEDDTLLKDAGLTEAAPELAAKDLGPQISWKTVFLVEYFGPLWIHPLFYYLPQLFYGRAMQHSTLQQYLFAAIMLHYTKRELETLFVHRFSHATMPFFNLFKNSGHYWGLSGLVLAYPLYSPTYAAGASYMRGTYRENGTVLTGAMAFWLFCELSNLKTHLTTRALRPEGSRKRAIPRGYGFDLVSFPNYLFEALGWLTVAALSGSWAAWAFAAVSTGQMAVWAQKKHAAYRREFGAAFPRGRRAMVPFLF